MAECMNWPPSRGPKPYTSKTLYLPGRTTTKDLPKPKEQELVKAEKEVITEMQELTEARPKTKKGKAPRWRKRKLKKPKPKPLVGTWLVWYQITDVLSLTVEQASSVLHGARVKPERREYDHWWDYALKPLWVDLTYPLSRGVRLVVRPMTVRREFAPVQRKGEQLSVPESFERKELTLGYFLWTVAKEYERIYREHKKYSVWGHEIGDLGFEQISIDKDGIVELFIGS